MPAYLYEIKGSKYHKVDIISLSGRSGLVFEIFEKRNLYSQLSSNKEGIGWEITKPDLQNQILLDGLGDGNNEILFDVEPNKTRTNIKQLEHIHVFSHNYKDRLIYWSVMMLELKTILFNDREKKNIEIFIPGKSKDRIIEFLYLKGEDRGWTYGQVGRMNAAMIEQCARDYFKKYF